MGRRSPSRAARSSTAAPSSTTGALVFTGHSRADRPADQVRPERFGSRAERDHRVGPSSRPVLSARRCAPCPARRAAPPGRGPIGRRGRRVPTLRRPRADAHRLAQLEARLERVHVQPRRRAERAPRRRPCPRGGRIRRAAGRSRRSSAPPRPGRSRGPGPRARGLEPLRPGHRAHHRLVHGAVVEVDTPHRRRGRRPSPSSRSTPLTVVEVDAPRREGGQLSRRPQRLERERARPHHHRHALGRAGGDVGRHHRLGGRRPRSPRSGPRSRPPRKPAGGSPQSAKSLPPTRSGVRTGTDRRDPEPKPARRRRPCAAAMRVSDTSRSIVAGLIARRFARSPSSAASCPCRGPRRQQAARAAARAGNRTGIIGPSRFEHTRSDASHKSTSAAFTAVA